MQYFCILRRYLEFCPQWKSLCVHIRHTGAGNWIRLAVLILWNRGRKQDPPRDYYLILWSRFSKPFLSFYECLAGLEDIRNRIVDGKAGFIRKSNSSRSVKF